MHLTSKREKKEGGGKAGVGLEGGGKEEKEERRKIDMSWDKHFTLDFHKN